jgi:tetratricopeptide (TPR) repeat protein
MLPFVLSCPHEGEPDDRPRGRRASASKSDYHLQVQLNPNDATAHNRYGIALVHAGRLDDAIREERRALELDPLSIPINRALGAAFYFARQYDQAIEQERKTLDLDPNFVLAHNDLGLAYAQKSMFKEGIAELEKAVAISPGNPGALLDLGYAYGVAGERVGEQRISMSQGERLRVLHQINEGSLTQ